MITELGDFVSLRCILHLSLCKPQLWRESVRVQILFSFTQATRSRNLWYILHKVFHYLSLSSRSGPDVAGAARGGDERTVLHERLSDGGRPG